MVAINPAMIAKVAKGAMNILGSVSKSGGQGGGGSVLGSIFDKFQIADGGILGKMGINNIGDLKAGLSMMKEDPDATSKNIAGDLGLSDNAATKIAGFAKKFLA